jgi:hypothetical protein
MSLENNYNLLFFMYITGQPVEINSTLKISGSQDSTVNIATGNGMDIKGVGLPSLGR